jgi:hypothetical protein
MISKKIAALTLLPIIVAGLYIHFFSFNIPFWDQWYFVQFLMMKDEGTLTLAQMFAQHNEHRPFFPRLAWFFLASLTRYNVKAELWASLCVLVGVFVFFARRAMRTWRENEVAPPLFLIPLLSLLLFNLSQRECWILGFCFQYFFGMACVVIGFFLLADGDTKTFIAAILLGFTANYSMVNGLFYWPLGLGILLLNESARTRLVKSTIWLVLATASIGFFLNGWTTSGGANFQYLFGHFFEWMLWILNFLGAPIFAFWYVAWVFGILSLYLFGVVLLQGIRSGRWKLMLPHFAIIAFVIITGLLISLGRMEDYGLLLPFVQLKRLRLGILYMLLTATLTILTFAGGWVGYVRFYLRILPAYQSVVSGEAISAEDLAQIHPELANAEAQIEFLREKGYSAWGLREK